ncbi:MAG TPA: hypothetical protein DCQ31_05635, partial [Bacteroidales bacterium]|nr:hypothetical protein [Bacteroidales bacterium]
MAKQFSVRYGRNYKVVLAIVLPCLLIIPFIFILQRVKNMEEWQLMLIIYGFLGGIIGLALWLVLRTYPPTILGINNHEISLSFKQTGFLSTSNISFSISDIVSLNHYKMEDSEYFLIETQNPKRKFQISAYSNSIEDLT